MKTVRSQSLIVSGRWGDMKGRKITVLSDITEASTGTPALCSWKEKHSLNTNPLAKVLQVWVEGYWNINMPVKRESDALTAHIIDWKSISMSII